MTDIVNKALWGDFKRFAKGQIVSGDLDPTYPLLASILSGVDDATAVWRTLLFVATYHLGSAEQLWSAVPTPKDIIGLPERLKRMNLPTGTERRCFRGQPAPLAQHIKALADEDMVGLLLDLRGHHRGADLWRAIRVVFQRVPYGGPWSSYKVADLLKHVHAFDATAPDLGIGGGGETSGPIPGLVRLTGLPWAIAANNVGLHERLLARAVDEGVPFRGLDQLETALCDFNSLCKGTYYVGHDIDDQMSKLNGLGLRWWDARGRIFPEPMLGERNGYFGVRVKLKRLYVDQGDIVNGVTP